MFLVDFAPLVTRILAAALVGYLLGSIPFAYLVARLKGIDIFETGSRRAGTANVFWHVGRRRGMMVFACDVLKGAAAVYVAWMFGHHELLGLIAGGAAIAGHWKSIFTGFKGGDGMVVLVGVSLAYLNWFVFIGIIAGIVSVLLFRRSVFRSSIGIFGGFGLMLAANQLLSHRGWEYMLGLTALALVVVTHNILTNADHRPETVPPEIDPDLLIAEFPEVHSEAAELSEEAILRQVIPQDDEGESNQPSR
ncbi:MAG: glycerol-3-phosphate acyltransferase [Chloroflexi bacterium]|nr:glycerol-3-phosphate acyltransferase [Chloroflexota bacterium]